MITELHVIDYGAQGEYGLFGKTICKSNVRGFTNAQIEEEKDDLRFHFGGHVSIVESEEVPAIRP